MNEMHAYGLIYGRTFYRDYESKFLLKPSCFSEEDVNWARGYILSAVSYCDELEGIRRVVFGNETYLVVGIVGILSNLFRMYMLGNEKNQYVLDGNGRNIKCFLGFVCDMKNKEPGKILQMEGVDYLNLYLNHIANDAVWFCKEPLDLRDQDGCDLKWVKADNHDYYRQVDKISVSNEDWDKKIFEYVMANISERNRISLCTNMYNKKMIDDGRFIYVTAGSYAVNQCQKEKSASWKEEQDYTLKHEESRGSKKKAPYESAAIAGGILILLFFILLIVLFISFII